MRFSYLFPPMDEFTLDNKLNIICIPDHEQNGLVAALQLPVGRFSDPPGFEGLCELTAHLLSKGTENLSADEFAEKLESTGAALSADVGEESSVFGIRMRSVSASSLLSLFADMVIRPRFAKEEFTRTKREMITSLRAERVDPGFIASRHFHKELAGNGHPAGRFETAASLKKITPGDVVSFFNDFFAPEHARCIIAGDCDRETMKGAVTAHFSSWRRTRKRSPASAPMLRYAGPTAIRLVDKPDLTQTTLFIGHGCPGELSPEKYALSLGNYIFGGGNFSSRLMTRIRSVAGKTYGVFSQLHTEADFGTFTITTSTRNRELSAVLEGILEEYGRFCREGVTADELEKAKRFATGNMAFQLEGIGNVVDRLLWLRFYGRRNSFIERFDEHLSSIDIKSVNNAIHTHLSPERAIIVAVGKKDEIQEQLRPFGAIKNYHFRDTL